MKKILLLKLIMVTLALTSFGQSPEAFKYQAVVRDASNTVLNNQAVGIRITIQQGSIGGTPVYQETFALTTNGYGLVNLEIGSGTIVSGDFTSIDWSDGPYFIETAVDVTGGTSYTVMGASELLSVPYALHSNTAENVTNDAVDDADADPTNEIQSISRAGSTVTLSNGGGSFEDSVGVYTEGTGIDITNNVISTTSTCNLSVGDTYQGGIIFYLDASGCHGLICAPTDQSTGIQWYNGSFTSTTAFASCVGCGDGNTSMIVHNQGAGSYASKLCHDLILGGEYDWYLPSVYELNLMWENIGNGNVLGLGNLGGFANSGYWSSTEDANDTNLAKGVGMNYGNNFSGTKAAPYYVRAVRSF